MRDSQRCTKCGHNRILFVKNVADRSGPDGFISDPIDPLMIARTRHPATSVKTGLTQAGIVTAYVCRACGFTEFYTLNPRDIPIDGTWVEEIVGPKKHEPYR